MKPIESILARLAKSTDNGVPVYNGTLQEKKLVLDTIITVLETFMFFHDRFKTNADPITAEIIRQIAKDGLDVAAELKKEKDETSIIK